MPAQAASWKTPGNAEAPGKKAGAQRLAENSRFILRGIRLFAASLGAVALKKLWRLRLPGSMLGCLALAACAAAPRPEIALYDFGPPPASQRSAPRTPPLLLEIAMPAWLDAGGIDYRLAYADAGRLHEYAWARWAAAPSRLIERRLLARGAYGPLARARPACVLRLEIGEFSQIFADPQQSRGVLQGRAVLLDPARRQLAEHAFSLAEDAPAADAGGGVTALSATIDRLADELLAWEGSWPAGACPLSR